MIVNASKQAQEIQRLQEDFGVANRRLDEVASDNARLKSEVADTWRLMSEVEKERDNAKAEVVQVRGEAESLRSHLTETVNDYNGRLQQAHDAMAQRDQRIAALEAKLRETEDRAAKAERENAETARSLQNEQNSVRYWTGRCEQAERENSQVRAELAGVVEDREGLQEKLSQVQGKLQEFRSLFEPTPPVVPPVQEKDTVAF
jgi:chromosome segregation ATPase